ncbi:uncharacterized protein SCHCODRAFT_02491655 [Schizophyllum commune H4-8]|nr:uncharacterized protein SCHCODRAFT_02491655 [Schizophyllum commune H4-8]KAI5896872.1 hypothetical protein SCHCODRAFT_02491655 [Schizophyllum commune H4-8]
MLPQWHYASRGAPSGSLSKAQRLDAHSPSSGPAKDDTNATYTPRLTNDDLSAIRSRYLDVDHKKREIRKMIDRKFLFDRSAPGDAVVDAIPSCLLLLPTVKWAALSCLGAVMLLV